MMELNMSLLVAEDFYPNYSVILWKLSVKMEWLTDYIYDNFQL